MTKQTKARGFTIVELLIVIVIIAILAAITIVAYNGIQNRARTSAAQAAASALAKKAETYYAENSQYPNTTSVITGTGTQNSVTTASTSSWYSAPGGAFTTVALATFQASTAAPADPKSIYYVPNGTNGGCAYYRDYAGNTWSFVQVGTATCTAGGPTSVASVAI